MNIFPAIDLFSGCAVRLYKGDYDNMTVYNENPSETAREFERAGAKCIHLVDLEGARTGGTPNLEVIKRILSSVDMFSELGGGIRSMETVDAYLSGGVNRVILGTAAVTDIEFLKRALDKYTDRIAVGVDIKDGFAAIKGWTEKSDYTGIQFCERMQTLGVKTVICTDISKDGAMKGTNHELYTSLSQCLDIDIIASGGVSSLEDVIKLKDLGISGAIIGKAYYTGAVDLHTAIEVAK